MQFYLAVIAAISIAAAPAPDSPQPTADNFAAWRDHISPTAAELRWTQILWLTTFGDGIAQADSQDKPLLLWVMNGHPLGCT